MWIVSIYDICKKEHTEVLIFDHNELIELMEYVKYNDKRLLVESMEPRCLCVGLDEFMELTDTGCISCGDESSEKPKPPDDTIPEKI